MTSASVDRAERVHSYIFKNMVLLTWSLPHRCSYYDPLPPFMNRKLIYIHSLLQEFIPSFFEVLNHTAVHWPALKVLLFLLDGTIFGSPFLHAGSLAVGQVSILSAPLRKLPALKLVPSEGGFVLIQIPGSLPLMPQNLPALSSLLVSPCCICPCSWKTKPHLDHPSTPQPLSLSTTSSLRSLSSFSQLPAPMTFPGPNCLATIPDSHLTSSAPHAQQPFDYSET